MHLNGRHISPQCNSPQICTIQFSEAYFCSGKGHSKRMPPTIFVMGASGLWSRFMILFLVKAWCLGCYALSDLWLFTWLSLVMSFMVSYFALSFIFSHEMSSVRSGTELSQFLRIFPPTFDLSCGHVTVDSYF